MGKVKKSRAVSRKKKYDLWVKLWKCLDKYKKVLVVRCNNIEASIFHSVRQALRPLDAVIVMGKNTLLKAGIRMKMTPPKEGDSDFEERKNIYKPMPELQKLHDICEGYLGLVFCKGNLTAVKDILKRFQCNKGAKIGALSPTEVNIQPGPTGLDPKQTSFFQALNIQTKIVKTQIEIINAGKILVKGQKIGASECALLDKLGIRPFNYEIAIMNVYDNGAVYSPAVLDITKEEIIQKLRLGASYLTAASLQSGYPTSLSVRQMVLGGFKNLIAVSMSSNYEFDAAKQVKVAAAEAMKEKEKPKEKKPEVKKEVKKVEEKHEEKKEEPAEDFGGFGNFFGDDEGQPHQF